MVLNELLGQTKVIYEVTEDYISVLLTFLIILKMMIIGKVSEPMPQVIRTQPALYTARFPYFQYIQDFPFLKPSEVCHFEFYFCSKTYRTFFFKFSKRSQFSTFRTQYDNQTFTGLGPRKEIAKNICAEQVLSQSFNPVTRRKGRGTGLPFQSSFQ